MFIKKWKLILLLLIMALVFGIIISISVHAFFIPNHSYRQAVALMDNGRYDEAIEAFTMLEGFRDSDRQIVNCNTAKYNQAVALMEHDVIRAYEALIALDGFMDSKEKASVIFKQYVCEHLKNAEIGECVFLGNYWQDADEATGKEPIEWLVLAKEDNKVLLLSKYALDECDYHYTSDPVTWETCKLRDWLNDNFLNDAFSYAEQSMISKTAVLPGENPEYNTDPGPQTKNKLFLLSISEVEQYLPSAEERSCIPTDYAIAQGVTLSSTDHIDGAPTCRWWLRSPGCIQKDATRVDSDGSIDHLGCAVDDNHTAVRPALWIKLEA